MPPLIRKRPLLERIKARLDPYDFLLWLSEELNDDTYDDVLNNWATPIGIAANLLFIIARGASSRTSSKEIDDVFSESGSKRGWFAWLFAFLVHFLTLICVLNTFYTFYRRRHYRLFEQPVDIAPATPGARRVKVDQSPATGSPLQYLRDAISNVTASRHAPDAEREVWEVSVWDAKPFNLTFFTLFSPGHILLYYALLPPTSADSRPSVTVLMTGIFGVVLAVQLGFLRTAFTQQTRDKALIQGEVMNEYNTKFVHPTLNKLMRDVSTQTRESTLSPRGTKAREVEVYTPTVVINRGFVTNPNTNYAGLYSPSADELQKGSNYVNNGTSTPAAKSLQYSRQNSEQMIGTPYINSSPLKQGSTSRTNEGYFGIYNHAASPLRKSSSNQLMRQESEQRRPTTTSYEEAGRTRRRETGRF